MNQFVSTMCLLGGSLGYAIGNGHGCAIGLAISSGLVLVLDFCFGK